MSKKTTVFIFTVVFVTIFLVGGYFIVKQIYNNLLNNLINQYAQEQLVLGKQTANILETEVKSTEEKLKLIAKIPEIKNGDQASCNKKLQEVLALNTRISNIGRVDVNKKFKCSINKALVGSDAQKLGPYINDIFNDPKHQTVMSRIIKVPTGGYAVAVHVPVFDDKNAFIGTVGGAIYFEEFSSKFLQNIKISNNGYIVLQDDDGTIFYHPQKELIGQNRRPKNSAEEATASAITSLITKASKDGSSGVSRYISSLDNTEKVGAYVPANIFPNRKWIVIVTVPVEAIQNWDLIKHAKDSFKYLLLIIIAFIILPPFLLLSYLNFSIFKPLDIIGKAAKEVGEGNLDIVIPFNSKDEIGTLAGFFNDMVLKLKNSYQGLEEKVRQKTEALTAQKMELEQANRKLLGLEKLKDEFVSLASHELRTPMTAIKGFISMIQEGDFGKLSKEMEEPINDIGASTDRLIHLVNDMLNVSRIEAGRLKFTLVETDLDAIIAEVISTLQPIAISKKIILDYKKQKEILVQADVDKVKQVLNNLVGNSLKFTDQGGIIITTEQEGDRIKIFIADTGMGITPDNQKKLFGKFQQISSQQKGKPIGTGLGLYLSKELVQKMGGDIWIEKSEIGKGSIFAFSLPIAKSPLANNVKIEIEKESQAHPDQKNDPPLIAKEG